MTFIIDIKTDNPDCKSIQAVLSHVVSSGYSYCVYIRNLRNENAVRPEKLKRETVSEYIADLENVLKFTHETFHTISDNELERFIESEKIQTSWKQGEELLQKENSMHK